MWQALQQSAQLARTPISTKYDQIRIIMQQALQAGTSTDLGHD